MYGNEGDVGRGLRASGVDRSEVFLATKVWPDDLAPDRVRASLERSLRELGTDYVDLFLIHWPNPRIPLAATLEAMTALREEGRTREIGVSNFTAAQFREALDLAPVIVNQVEYHVYLDQSALLEVCRERNAELCAYRPLGKGQVTSDPVIAEIAAAHDATPAQVALAWLVGPGGRLGGAEGVEPGATAGEPGRAAAGAQRRRSRPYRRAAEGAALRRDGVVAGLGLN